VQSTDIDVELGGLKYGHAMPEKKHAKTEKGVAGTMLFGCFAPMTRRACWKSSVRRSFGKSEMATPKSCGNVPALPRKPMPTRRRVLRAEVALRSALSRRSYRHAREPFPNGESMTKVSKWLQVTTFAVRVFQVQPSRRVVTVEGHVHALWSSAIACVRVGGLMLGGAGIQICLQKILRRFDKIFQQ
jgi:hypothetical protein